MGLSKDIDELKEAGVISEEVAQDIRAYYAHEKGFSTHRLFMVFGVLGAILVGLGIILIIAHNWDDLSRTVKTIFAFIPLIAGQILCGYARFVKKESSVWRESASAFLCFAVAASISLISQIYNIPGNLSGFLLVWMLLSIPLIYIMDVSIVSIIGIIVITWYACETSYWHYPIQNSYLYWVIMGVLIPHYLKLFKTRPDNNSIFFHHWLIPISLIIVLGTLAEDHGTLMSVAYMNLFGMLYLLGSRGALAAQANSRNGFKVAGILGMIVLLLMFSFDAFWEAVLKLPSESKGLMFSPELWVTIGLMILAVGLLALRWKEQGKGTPFDPFLWVFCAFAVLFLIGLYTKIPVVLINVLLLALGIYKIWEGNRRDHLGVMNFGLLIIIALVICRFFDTDLTFVVRGLMFITVGAGCFLANYQLLKRRKAHE